MPQNFTGYAPGGSIGPTGGGPYAAEDTQGYWSLEKCRRAYSTYLDNKQLEIREQQIARRYRHGVQWTAEQIGILNDRKQPVVTYNRIGRKIDGIVGLTERLKQDPKAFPRTPQHQQGADLATAILRYLMDVNRWNEKGPIVAESASIDGLAGIELDLKPVPPKVLANSPPPQPSPSMMGPPGAGGSGMGGMGGMGNIGGGGLGGMVPPNGAINGMGGGGMGTLGGMSGMGGPPPMGGNVIPFPQRMMGNEEPIMPPQPPQPDYDVVFSVVDNDGFFYDPRSYKNDFSDARYLGMGKWVDEELLIDLMPEFADQIKAGSDRAIDLSTSSDRDNRWFNSTGDFRQIRLVDVWYRHQRGWCWSLFTGSAILKEGRSPFRDEYGEEFSKYLMFSAQVDQDGDRYGFPRNLMSAQDEINQRRSKGLHELNSRRIRATKAAIADTNVEALRREGQRPDGIILTNTSIDDIVFDDQAKQAALMGQLEFLKEAKAEIENFGPNPALIGQGAGGVAGSSGRAIALLQQAGIAELGPYMINLRSWKIRVYRALFNAAQQYWTQQRWIRVTDNMGAAQFVQINGMGADPMTGMPTMINPIGELDVDIVLDEGPDSITMMQDTYDAISQALPSVAKLLSPQQVGAVLEVLIETSPLPAEIKKKFRDAGNQPSQPPPPSPEQQAKMVELQMERQKNKDQLQFQAAKLQQDGEIKQQQAVIDAKLNRDKADQEMALAREKAQNELQIEQFKAIQQAQMQRDRMLSGYPPGGPPPL